MNDWLDELESLRKEDEERQKEESIKLDLSILGRHSKAEAALRACQAHKLLRHVNNVLLLGKGMIDFFDLSEQYDKTATLVWQGPISNAKRPDPDDPSDYFYIIVGAKGKKVYCNHKDIGRVTPENLKAALIQAAKKPLVQEKHGQ